MKKFKIGDKVIIKSVYAGTDRANSVFKKKQYIGHTAIIIKYSLNESRTWPILLDIISTNNWAESELDFDLKFKLKLLG